MLSGQGIFCSLLSSAVALASSREQLRRILESAIKFPCVSFAKFAREMESGWESVIDLDLAFDDNSSGFIQQKDSHLCKIHMRTIS
jgi:hypothetical protein